MPVVDVTADLAAGGTVGATAKVVYSVGSAIAASASADANLILVRLTPAPVYTVPVKAERTELSSPSTPRFQVSTTVRRRLPT